MIGVRQPRHPPPCPALIQAKLGGSLVERRPSHETAPRQLLLVDPAFRIVCTHFSARRRLVVVPGKGELFKWRSMRSAICTVAKLMAALSILFNVRPELRWFNWPRFNREMYPRFFPLSCFFAFLFGVVESIPSPVRRPAS